MGWMNYLIFCWLVGFGFSLSSQCSSNVCESYYALGRYCLVYAIATCKALTSLATSNVIIAAKINRRAKCIVTIHPMHTAKEDSSYFR